MNTLFIGQELIRFETIESTNAFLKQQLGLQELPEGFTVVAKHQTSGRGQFGNHWEDQAGKNLLISVLLRPAFLSPRHSFYLNMSVCLAIHDFFERYHSGFSIKWPNDILLGGHKYAGVLMENQMTGRQINSAILGMGINLNQEKFSSRGARSLRWLKNRPVDLAKAEERLLECLESRYLQLRIEGLRANLKKEYLSKLYGYQRLIPVQRNGEQWQALITDVSDDGLIAMRDEQGRQSHYSFKQIKFLL